MSGRHGRQTSATLEAPRDVGRRVRGVSRPTQLFERFAHAMRHTLQDARQDTRQDARGPAPLLQSTASARTLGLHCAR